MMIKIYNTIKCGCGFSIAFILLFFSACTRHLSQNSDFAYEKEKILRHYSAPKDSLKRKAALFLLEHIHIRYSNENDILKEIEREYAKVKQREGYIDSYERFISVLQSKEFSGTMAEFDKVSDTQTITARYIIRNIDRSFDAWQNAAWSGNVDFETFLEYILPYRVMNEPLGFDRRFFRKEFFPLISNEQNMHTAFNKIIETRPIRYHRAMDETFPFLMSIGLSDKIGIGNCVQQAVSEAMILRSVGIPATVDYVPQWGNFHGMHYAVKLIDSEHKSAFDLSFSDVNFTIPADSLPESVPEIRYHKSVPKVYRMMWSVQPERLALNSNGRVDKTSLFGNLYEKDVTDEYTETSTFQLRLADSTENIAYLCVFDRRGWMPVAATPIDNDWAVFEKVGREVVFLPAIFVETGFDSGYMQPIGYPFYFTDDGTLVTLSGTENRGQTVKLFSKYPVHSYTAVHAYRMKGGRFQGANNRDFSDAKNLFTIDYYPFYRQEITIESDETFRYFRYLPPQDVLYSFAELQFYTRDRNNSLQPIEGTFFESHPTHSDFSLLIDNDLDTFVRSAPVQGGWIGYDVDKDSADKDATRHISTIVFAPQNDGNCIVPDFVYELFIWQNNNWQPLGEKKAAKNYLEYNDIPIDALLWLRCYTRGREERIFTYGNNRQIWW